MGQEHGRTGPKTRLRSSDADVAWASEFQHSVERVGDAHFGCPAFIRARAQPVADHLFPTADGDLGPSACVVSRRFLPSHLPVFDNELQVAVTLRAFGCVTEHSRRAWRHAHGRCGMVLGDAGVKTILVMGAVAGERRHGCSGLVEQGTGLEGVYPCPWGSGWRP